MSERRLTRAACVLAYASVLAVPMSACTDPVPSRVAGTQDIDEECSTGPAHPEDATFPFTNSADTSLPECVPRCGAVSGGLHQAYYIDGLPSGSCANVGVACQMGAQRRCSCPEVNGPLSAFVCRCDSAGWSCAIAFQGAASCGPCASRGDGGQEGDAGTEAGPE